MICVEFTTFCDLRADLRNSLATFRQSVRKFWFCKLAMTCIDLRVRLARAYRLQFPRKNNKGSSKECLIVIKLQVPRSKTNNALIYKRKCCKHHVLDSILKNSQSPS